MSVHSAIKRLARIGLHQLGGLQPILWRSRHSFRILTYHRFSPHFYTEDATAALDRQCEFLKRHFRVTPLAEIAKHLQEGTPIPPRTLVVTIDDGYRDILTDAMPAFRKWEIPATAYLISDFLDGKLWPWWDQVSFAVTQTRKQAVSMQIGDAVEQLNLRTPAEKAAAISRIGARVVKIPDQARHRLIASLGTTFEVDIPGNAPAGHGALSWDEVRTLADAGMEFGAHTKTHPILPNVEDRAVLREEIAGSRDRIEKELGRPVIHFCYPNGDWNETTETVVTECGFSTTVTTHPGLNRQDTNRYRLNRLSVEPGFPDEYFREQVAGMHMG